MSLISRLFHAVQSWRRRPGVRKPSPRAAVNLEYLDHRQLLSVNFTGNVATDFPATETPGVVVIPDNPSVLHPGIPPLLQDLVKVSGFDISGLRVSYTPSDDILSIGIEQPLSQQPTHPGPVIAGDADNNGNDGTVDPAVTAADPNFQDFPDFGGSEFMGAFLDLNHSGTPDVVAGYSSTDPRSPKQYQVAQAEVNPTNPTGAPLFGTMLPAFTGNVYKVNSPDHPNLEFAITHFSQLYQMETGQPLTPNSVIGIGAMAGSGDDDGIGEAFFPEQPFTLSAATVPTPTPPVCPPASPSIEINPHENRHINTAHPDLIRVTVFGSSGFDVTQINPATVTFGGAHPVMTVIRHANHDKYVNYDEFLDETFVFKGTDVHLPPGIIEATISGSLNNGQTFSSSARVFNKDASFYSSGQAQQQANRWSARGGDRPYLGATLNRLASAPPFVPGGATVNVLGVSNTTVAATAPQVVVPPQVQAAAVQPTDQTGTGPVVAIPRRGPASATARGSQRSTRLRGSLDQYFSPGVLQPGPAAMPTSA